MSVWIIGDAKPWHDAVRKLQEREFDRLVREELAKVPRIFAEAAKVCAPPNLQHLSREMDI
jgi:hypothetical protein